MITKITKLNNNKVQLVILIDNVKYISTFYDCLFISKLKVGDSVSYLHSLT